MIRFLNALFLSVVLVFTSITFAAARGGYSGAGTDMVICTGTGLIVLSIGDDGEPVEKMLLCPDAISLFSDSIATPMTPEQSVVVVDVLKRLPVSTKGGIQTLTPSARGPPLVV